MKAKVGIIWMKPYLSIQLNLYTTLQSLTVSVQVQNRDFPVYFFPTGKILFSLQGSQLMETGFSL